MVLSPAGGAALVTDGTETVTAHHTRRALYGTVQPLWEGIRTRARLDQCKGSLAPAPGLLVDGEHRTSTTAAPAPGSSEARVGAVRCGAARSDGAERSDALRG